MSKRPVIALTGDFRKEEARLLTGCRTVCVNNAYAEAVLAAGGVPIVMPVSDDRESVEQTVAMADGLLVTGGGDINPLLFGEEPVEAQGFFSRRRDFLDFTSIRCAMRLGRPVLGICRGVQSLNVVCGGTLYQDLSLKEGTHVKHMQDSEPDGAGHTVEIDSSSLLYGILGGTVQTNSFHHQAVSRVAPGFAATGRARDGVIELIEKQDGGFAMGIQWHPELMAAGGSRPMQAVFDRFVEACRTGGSRGEA